MTQTTESGGQRPARPALRAIDGDKKGDADASPSAPHEEVSAANDEAIRMKIAKLEQEHRDLDQAIETMEERMPYDRLTIQRLKKRKLALKDQITKLHDEILPDIIA